MSKHRQRDRSLTASRRNHVLDSVTYNSAIDYQIRRQVCDRKHSYPTKFDARRAMRDRNQDIGHVYECDVCRKWHITSMTRDDARRVGVR